MPDEKVYRLTGGYNRNIMAKLGLIFAYQDIMDTAEKVLPETEDEIVYKNVVKTTEAVEAARRAAEAGADIVICRGYQAVLIKQFTNIPVVELRLHVQEVGLLIKKAKEIVKTERPRIGLIVFKNMLCDTSCMDELFGVELKTADIIRTEEIMGAVREMAQEGVDIFIGGASVCDAASDMGYPALLYNSSEESIREAVREADRMAYAMEVEKSNEAQFATFLDTTFNGIIKINAEGRITTVNRPVEDILGRNGEDVVGQPVCGVFPEFDETMIKNILDGKSESYTVSVNLRRQAWILLMAPIQYEDTITGAILSLQKLSENIRRKDDPRRGIYLGGYRAEHEFRDFYTEDATMKQQLELAKRYALSDSPVLIYGETGTEYAALAEAVHNNSSRRNEPFIVVDLGAIAPEEQMRELFGGQMNCTEEGEDGRQTQGTAIMRANHGTLFIKRIDCMIPPVQDQILRIMHTDISPRTGYRNEDSLVVRLIAYTNARISSLVKQGKFSPELYYQLQSLIVEIPSLNMRPKDLSACFDRFFDEFNKKYNRYLVCTKGAKERILKLSWEGNLQQLRGFCERLVITAEKRSVDEVAIQQLYDSLYPRLRTFDGDEKVVIYRTPEADEIEKLLEEHHGNRKEVAARLGISTTTLWRRMKKYGVE